jgi:myosin heavy subunit
MVGSAALTLGCVSQQTYNSARQEVKEQSTALAQTQAEIQALEQQRDDAHAANKRDEQALAGLRSEIAKIQASYDQIQKANQAKLAALRHNIAALRARHQAMLKEISETKRYERRLQAITEQQAQQTEQLPAGPDAHVIQAESAPQEQRLVAVITPQSNRADNQATTLGTTPPQAADTPAVAPQATPAIVATSAAHGTPAKIAPAAPVAPPSQTPTVPSAPQDDSWFSSLTGWLTSLFDWLWT